MSKDLTNTSSSEYDSQKKAEADENFILDKVRRSVKAKHAEGYWKVFEGRITDVKITEGFRNPI